MDWDRYEFIELTGPLLKQGLAALEQRKQEVAAAETEMQKLIGIRTLRIGWRTGITPGSFSVGSLWLTKDTPESIIPKCLRLDKKTTDDKYNNYRPNIARQDGRELKNHMRLLGATAPIMAFMKETDGLPDDVVADNGYGQSIMLTQCLSKFGSKMAIRVPFDKKNKKRKLPKGMRWVPNSTVMSWVEKLQASGKEPTI